MADSRRAALFTRQRLLAEAARRDAMAGLAEALAEQQRSARIVDRSESLAQTYAAREAAASAGDLQRENAFKASLKAMAIEAERASADARDQARWQAETLAAAEHKARSLDERLRQLRARLDAERLGRELSQASGRAAKGAVARQLHEVEAEREPSPAKLKPRTRS